MSESAYERVTAALAAATGYQPPNERGGWKCPAHTDNTPSLSVSNGGGKVLVHCQAGCDLPDVLRVLELEYTDLFDDDEPQRKTTRELVAEYSYTDAEGHELFQAVRFIPKDFRQRRRAPDDPKADKDGWVWNLQGVPRVLYRLPALIEAVSEGRRVFVVEGEKDVHALEAVGEVATCCPMGAGKWKPEYGYAEHFKGADVVIVADDDPAGAKHAADVEASLLTVASSVRMVRPAVGKDAADHLAAGKSVDEFVCDEPAPARVATGFFLDWEQFWARDRRDADWLYEDVLARGRGHSLFAGHKVGKSLLMLFLVAQVVAAGGVVIYLDYEMGEDDLYDRLADMGYGPGTDFSRLRYALLPSLPPLDTAEGARALLDIYDEEAAKRPDEHIMVVIDTTGRAVGGEENSADTYRNFYRWTGLGLKQRGATWARLDHAGKDPLKGQRGSSAKGDDVDVVWKLSRTDSGLELKRDVSRMGWVPERVIFRQVNDPHLRFVKVEADWPAGTKAMAELLDRLGVALDSSERPAGAVVRATGASCGQHVLRAALKFRRKAEETGYR